MRILNNMPYRVLLCAVWRLLLLCPAADDCLPDRFVAYHAAKLGW